MTMQLSLEYGAVSPLDLQAGGYKVIDGFYPQTATDLEKHVFERVDVLITGSSKDDLRDKIRALERIFEQARGHTIGPDGVYFNFAPDQSDDIWRARAYDGKIMLDKRLDHNWRSNKVIIGMTIERAPAWDGPEAQIPLSNPLDSDNTDGLTVYNPNLHCAANTISFDSATKQVRDSANGLADFLTGMTVNIYGSTSNDGDYTITDGGHAGYFVITETLSDEAAGDNVGIDAGRCNYVEIAAADVEGDLPAPVRLELTNNYNNASRASHVWTSQNFECDPGNLNNILEAEDASDFNARGTVTDLYTATGNQYHLLEWTGTTEVDLLSWTLSTTLLNQLKGRYVRLMVRFVGSHANYLWLRFKIKIDTVTLWDGPLTQLATGRNVELITLRVPPYLLQSPGLYPLTLIMSGKTDLASYSAPFDFVQIMPVDGWRPLVNKGFGFQYEARLVDDGIDGYLYTYNWTTPGKVGNFVGYGEPIQLQPGKLQRLYFQISDANGGADTYRTLSVKLYYRPRRLTL